MRIRRGQTTSIGVLGTIGALAGLATSPVPVAQAAAGAWSVSPVPDAAVQFTNLQSVDTRTDSDAWAVGYVHPPAGGPFQPLALRWTGSSWAKVPVPQQGNGTTLYGVSASQANDAWAVGSFFVPVGYRVVQVPTALHWTGAAWSPTAVPGAGTWFGVADLSPTNAWAVGAEGVKHWNGQSWSDVATPSPNPSGVGAGSLSAIAASSATDVWAVGSYRVTRHISASFTLHFDGSSWRVVSTPNATTTRLFSVASTGPRDAWAVGQRSDGAFTEPVTEHWNGTAWSIVSSPSFPANGAYLRSVTARSASDVWAAGLTLGTDTDDPARTLTLHWSGTAWSTVPSPPSHPATLWWISTRAGASRVWAVGEDDGNAAPGRRLVLDWH